tara:strand:- start:56 stop:571 length:516 start_codon:yes stop_codon:yes gene_type:complete
MDKFFLSFASEDAISSPEGVTFFNRIWEVPVGLNDRYLNYQMRVTNVVSSDKQTITDGTNPLGQNVSALLELGITQAQNNLNSKGKQIVGVVQSLNTTGICGLQINNPNTVSISNIKSGDRIQFKLVSTAGYGTFYRTDGGNDADFVVCLELEPMPEEPKAFSNLKSLSIQ